VGDGQLRFEVGDDGCGIDEASRRAGVGLQNMRDRVEALSGTGSVRSGPAGTLVRGAMLSS
jgi:signal transduction histidine kinase